MHQHAMHGVGFRSHKRPRASSFRTAATRFLSMLITVRAPRYSSNARRLRRQLGSGSDTDSVTHSPIGVRVRYKTWRSRKDTHLHLLCAEGSEAFESLPVAICNLGPWQGGPEGEVTGCVCPTA